jgi:hypothetical protein
MLSAKLVVTFWIQYSVAVLAGVPHFMGVATE